jgi:hypothetical protein
MKKLVAILFVFSLTNIFSQTSISPQFSELKVMEDQQGNTHLFYRINTYYENPPVYQWSNNIYHWDLLSGIDTLFISDSGIESPGYNFNKWVSDVDYWNNNPAEFIFSGGATAGQFFEGSAYITRFDGYTNYFGLFHGFGNYIDIATSDDSLLYAGIYADGGPGILQSLNGGRSWDSLSAEYQFLSLCPSNDNIYFVENADRQLLKTTDAGNTFTLVDSEFVVDSRFFYDSDGQHIYRKTSNKLIVSDNLGGPSSWNTAYTTTANAPFNFCNDNSVPGSIFITEGRTLFHSHNYGNSFYEIAILESDIVGLYKEPDSEVLFIATLYRIYKYDIYDPSFEIIKSITPASEVYDWFPLNIGNYWVYVVYHSEGGIGSYLGVETLEIVDTMSLANGLKYFLYKHSYLDGSSDTTYIRLDSLSGKLFAYSSVSGNDLLFDDLMAELGDTVCYEFNPTWSCQIVQLERGYDFYQQIYLIKEYRPLNMYSLFSGHTLMKGMGMLDIYHGTYTNYNISWLKGCIIDGIVYGDTSLFVSVDDEENLIASEFKLEQNYPNPFNPSTTIRYEIPERSFVTIKVYDVLGNEIATLVNEEKPAGEYEVEFRPESSIKQPASGIYFYQLKAGSFTQTKKMILLK